LRRILFTLAVLIALLLAVEVGLTMLSQRGLALALRGRYGLPRDLEARISSFPLLMSLARNHLAELQLSWSGTLTMVHDGSEEEIPCSGSARLYDIELDLSSLLMGKLELRSISRLEAALSLDREAVARMLERGKDEVTLEEGRVCLLEGGAKRKLRVKVVDENAVALEESAPSTGGSGSGNVYQPSVYTFDFNAVPLEAEFRTASVTGERLRIEISIPMWEGYL